MRQGQASEIGPEGHALRIGPEPLRFLADIVFGAAQIVSGLGQDRPYQGHFGLKRRLYGPLGEASKSCHLHPLSPGSRAASANQRCIGCSCSISLLKYCIPSRSASEGILGISTAFLTFRVHMNTHPKCTAVRTSPALVQISRFAYEYAGRGTGGQLGLSRPLW